MAVKTEQLRLDRETSSWEQDFKRDELDADIILRQKEMELKYQEAVDVVEIKAGIDRARSAAEALKKPKRVVKTPIRDASGLIISVEESEVEAQ